MSEPRMSLRKASLGNTSVPRVGLGCMGMSEFYGASDERVNRAILGKAFELGYRHFDTADMYGGGENELLIGRFLQDVPRDQAFVATKFGIVRDSNGGLSRTINGRPEYVREACERSLRRLGSDYIDLYYVHRRDPSVPIEETVGAMAELVKAGKVRALGLSEMSVDTLRRAHGTHPIAALQTEYSLISREPDAELLPACAQMEISFVAYSPLSRGLLTGVLGPAEVQAPGDARQFLPRFAGENFRQNLSLLDELKAIAQAKSVTVSQLALAWVLARGEHIHTIPGTRREQYLADNFAAQHTVLTDEERDRITAAVDAERVAGARYPTAATQGIGG